MRVKLLSIILLLCGFVAGLSLVVYNDIDAESMDDIWEHSYKVAASNISLEEDLLDYKQLKQEIIKENKEEQKLNNSNKYFYIESSMGKKADETEYEFNSEDNVIATSYEIDDNELRFVWEYCDNNAEEYLANTISQLSLCELYPDSELYTYSNWYDVKEGLIDVYWADKDYSYIANIPVELLKSDIEFVKNFCTTKKVTFNK